VLVVFTVDTLHGDPRAFWGMIAIVVLGVVTDAVWKRARRRRPVRRTTPQPS
jgi:hypothetical protein